MDEGRFDELARRLAALATRRGLVGAALTPALMLFGLADDAAGKKKGKKGNKGKGKGKNKKKKKGASQCANLTQPCVDHADCCGELACDTGNTCCAPFAASCASDAECCAGGECRSVGGGESRCCSPPGASCVQDRQCCSNHCLPNNTCGCLGNGAGCEDSDECCGSSICHGSEERCCAPLGAACSGHQDCCSGTHICQNGECACQPGFEVCNGVCAAECPASIAVRNPLTCGCCRINGFFPSACNVPYPCCSGACVPSGPGSICVGLGDGDSCHFDPQCDSDDCDDGVCEAPPCLGNGEDCEASAECCGALICHAFGAAVPACCASFGVACSSDEDCCVVSGGMVCAPDVGGSPRCCLPQGRSCANDAQCCSINCTDNHCA